MIRFLRGMQSIVLLSVLLLPSQSVSAGTNQSIDIPLSQLNGDQVIDFKGLISTQEFEFSLPESWKINEASWLDLRLTASELLDSSASSITISLNGLQVTSIPLSELTGTGKRINLPTDFFITGENILSITGSLSLPDDLETNCKGWDDPSRWSLMDPLSSLHLAFEKQKLSADLSNFPDIFVQPLDRYIPDGGDATVFVLPDEILPDDLNALTATAYFLGHHAGSDFAWNPHVVTKSEFDQIPSPPENVIFINTIPGQFGEAITRQKNAIGIFPSPWDISKSVMIIYDKERTDGYTPALIFGDWIRKVLLDGNVAYFDRTPDRQPPAFKNTYTFEELGYLDRTVRGIGEASLIYKLYIPYNIDPTSSNLSLQITHSPDLDPLISTIAVNLNGFTIASILPTTQNSRLEPIRVGLPAKRFRPGINYLRIAFDLHVPYSSCEKAPESVWGTIFNNSTFELTYENRTPSPSLDHFPVPFTDYPGATFVIPDELNLQTLHQVAQLTFAIGASSYYASQPPQVITASSFSYANNKQVNYIFAGLPSENPAIREFNDFLPQPFKAETNQLEEGFGVFLPVYDSAASVGLMQISPSPWDSNRTIFVLTGTDSQGLGWAWDAVMNPEIRTQFTGNLMIAGPGSNIASGNPNGLPANIQFEQTPVVLRIPIIGKFLQQSGQSEAAVSILAVALGGLFTLIALKVVPLLPAIIPFIKGKIKARKNTEDGSHGTGK
jgi:hypothetical protein